jgi:hypothetical protein
VEIPTVLGITWRKASAEDIIILIAILLIPILLIILIKLYKRYKSTKIHDSQLLLFKLKRLGFSNFQIKIINNLIEILRFSNPNRLFEKQEYFESAVGRFLTHARGTGEDEDQLGMICRDLSVIHDKLYHPTRLKRPLKNIQDIDENQLIYFTTDSKRVFLGKIISMDSKSLYIKTFGSATDFQSVPIKKQATFHVFRTGDAEYVFKANVTGRENGALVVEFPEEFLKGEESRHPYIDVIIPAQLSKLDSMKGDQEKIGCTIYKINEYEAVLRVNMKLDHDYQYNLEFTELDFNFIILSMIIIEKTVEESGVFYYTLKFNEMSESASRILKKYIYALL